MGVMDAQEKAMQDGMYMKMTFGAYLALVPK